MHPTAHHTAAETTFTIHAWAISSTRNHRHFGEMFAHPGQVFVCLFLRDAARLNQRSHMLFCLREQRIVYRLEFDTLRFSNLCKGLAVMKRIEQRVRFIG